MFPAVSSIDILLISGCLLELWGNCTISILSLLSSTLNLFATPFDDTFTCFLHLGAIQKKQIQQTQYCFTLNCTWKMMKSTKRASKRQPNWSWCSSATNGNVNRVILHVQWSTLLKLYQFDLLNGSWKRETDYCVLFKFSFFPLGEPSIPKWRYGWVGVFDKKSFGVIL